MSDAQLVLAFVLDGQTFTASVKDGDFAIERGAIENPDITFVGGPNELTALVYGGQSIAQMIKTGKAHLSGDQKVLARFTKLFPLPAKAPQTFVDG